MTARTFISFDKFKFLSFKGDSLGQNGIFFSSLQSLPSICLEGTAGYCLGFFLSSVILLSVSGKIRTKGFVLREMTVVRAEAS